MSEAEYEQLPDQFISTGTDETPDALLTLTFTMESVNGSHALLTWVTPTGTQLTFTITQRSNVDEIAAIAESAPHIINEGLRALFAKMDEVAGDD